MLGVGLGLVLLVGLVASLAYEETRPVDGGELLAEWYGVETLPFGLEVSEAVRRGGRHEVLLADPDAPEEASKQEAAKEDDGDLAPVDWTEIPVGPEGTPPFEVLVLHWPTLGAAAGELERLFGRPGGGDDDNESEVVAFGPGGGRAVLDSGRLPWGEYAVMFVHERELEAGGTFRDVIRANLALDSGAGVVLARWPRGIPGSKARMIELIAAFSTRP